MKEILDNWKQFINEQQPRTAEQRLDMFTRAVLDLNATSDDKKWQTIKKKAARFPMKKVADMMRSRIYNTFDSNVGEKSFARFVMAGKEKYQTKRQFGQQEIVKYYRDVMLPKVKEIIDDIPIVNVATPEASQMWAPGVEFVAKSMQKGEPVGGFFDAGASTPPFIGINPYAYIDDRGEVNAKGVSRAIAEELAHAVDGLIESSEYFFFSNLLSGDIEKIIKKQEDTDVKDKDYYDYLASPVETYAKLKVVKTELQGINRELFFDDEGRIILRHLKTYLENPKNKDKNPILRILNIQKIEDIGKVLDQIARVDQQKNTQMA